MNETRGCRDVQTSNFRIGTLTFVAVVGEKGTLCFSLDTRGVGNSTPSVVFIKNKGVFVVRERQNSTRPHDEGSRIEFL